MSSAYKRTCPGDAKHLLFACQLLNIEFFIARLTVANLFAMRAGQEIKDAWK